MDSIPLVEFFTPDGSVENGIKVFYDKQQVTFICRSVPWMFARGNWIMINYWSGSGSSVRATTGNMSFVDVGLNI